MAARKKQKDTELPLIHKLLFALIAIIVVVFIGMQLQLRDTKDTAMPQPTTAITPEAALLADVAVWYPSAPWSNPHETKSQTPYGDLNGEEMTATVTSDNASITHFEMEDELTKMGFEPDNSLAADGPGSSQWGYKKEQNGQTQLLIFSYRTQPSSTNPNEPLQFDCPCTVDVSVFASDPTPSK